MAKVFCGNTLYCRAFIKNDINLPYPKNLCPYCPKLYIRAHPGVNLKIEVFYVKARTIVNLQKFEINVSVVLEGAGSEMCAEIVY